MNIMHHNLPINLYIKKFLLMSKYVFYGICLQVLFGAMVLANDVSAQGNSVNDIYLEIELENVSFAEAFRRIENSTDFRFNYNNFIIKKNKKITLPAKDKSLGDLLKGFSRISDLQFKRVNEIIYVVPKKRSAPPLTEIYEKTIADLKIKGRVTDSRGEGVPGANVLVKGTSNGVITDAEGKYSITVPEGGTLVFSFVGYFTQEIAVKNESVLDVVLVEDVTALDEIVVVGYGYQKKSDLTGSIVSLGDDDLNSGGTVSNIAQSIQGRAAGVQVTQNSKAPGGSISVRIRGSNSIGTNNEPLYVIDGFPTKNGTNLNPDDIASVEILKDASATAIYGSRGANGVVIITTKRGKAGENSITYNFSSGVQKLVNPFTMLNGKQYMQLANELYQEVDGQEGNQFGVYTPAQLESNVNTNWIDETTRNGIVTNHNLQFTGGSEKTRVLTSFGHFNQKGVLKNTDFSRLSGRLNIDQKVNEYIRTGVTLFAQRENSNFQVYDGNILQSNVLFGLLTYDPTVPIFNLDGSYGRPPGGRGDNPVANLEERQNDLKRDKVNGTIFLEVKPFENLTARVDAGVDVVHDFQGSYLPRSTFQGGIDNGVASTADFTSTHHLFDVFVTYNKDLTDKHSFSIMGGYSHEKTTSENRSIGVKGFSTDLFSYNNLDAASTITGVSSGKSESLLISYFGRVNYSFNSKYLATFTLRSDGSSRFGTDNRWALFPSGSFAWRLIEEPLIRDMGIFSDLKLRVGYGKTGNDGVGNYDQFALVRNTHVTFDGSTNVSGTHLNQGTPENPSLKWETTSQTNIGLDMSFFNSRLTATLDMYYKKTTDLLIRRNLPSYSGFTVGQSNVGSLENKGFELEVRSKNMVGEFKWETSFNFASNRNKVLSLGGESDIHLSSSKPAGFVSEEDIAIVSEGEPLGSLYGYEYLGVIQAGETYAPQPDSKPGDPKFRDISGPEGTPDGLITSADRTIIGQAAPDFIFGVTNTFSYKNFDMSIFFHGSIGNQLFNMTRINLEWKSTTDALNRWTPQNTNTNVPRNGFYYSKYGGYMNDHFIEDASFLRLQRITLGYTVPHNLKFLQSIRLYTTVENLFTITDYSGWDPEVDTKGYENDQLVNNNRRGSSPQAANAGAGLDFNSYPSMRSFTVGLNVTF